MNHKHIIIFFISIALIFCLIHLIKNRPQYLLLLGIRGLLCTCLIRFVNYLCTLSGLSLFILANPISIFTGALLGFPGILLLYLSKLYLL